MRGRPIFGPGDFVRGQVLELEFLGAVARRDFAAGDPLIASDFVKPNERGFLAAVLKPGARAFQSWWMPRKAHPA